jgi:GNAT superfamily N-acetyltransferase
MFRDNWVSLDKVEDRLLVAFANLFLPRVGFSHRTLKRLTVEDPHYSSSLSGVYVDSSGEAKALLVTSVDVDMKIAWIKLLVTHPDYAHRLDSRLDQFLEHCYRLGVSEIRVSDRAGYHFRAGLEKPQRHERLILEKRGFKPVRSVADLEVDLCLFTEYRPNRFTSGGYVFGPPENSDRLLGFVESNFGVHWRRETEASLEHGGVVQATRDGEPVGFAAYSGFEDHWFGPTGVAKQHRGKGVGSELLFAALTRMRERGLCRITIPWTDLLTFYGQTGAVTGVRNLDIMRLEL